MSDSIKKKRFQTVVMPHLNSAFNLACWLTHNHQDAEDVVQEAYLRAFRFFDGFHGEDGRAWLLTIVRNTFYSWYQERQKLRQETAFDEQLHQAGAGDSVGQMPPDNNPEALLISKDSERQLQQALQALPLEFREVMVMRELEELSYKQIAGIVGIPIGTVMSRLGRGRKLLAAILAPDTAPQER
ncbi:sigma-70 family RNA polymerase sigma factor [Collimonas pratensis]|uniref:RNA polymerase sigma factor n=2 Tax=Collimonas pratensis TaxID=279113 RepID=A0A127Q408_9BURK|nr:sigma-70 family RNA polymerase sigma factor [Collimonas pratensis]AMP04757.1 RNA polymerase sigma factor, sigma-70 family protein [Collimonas pratensis]NKI69615.1 sigma-70 family RNA polymerase sigma factor [Collimonas pratensis]